MSRNRIAAIILAITVCGGCRSGHRWPFQPQGTIRQQQSEALVHDPYPQRDIAPDDAATRPREFINPLPEPVRNSITPRTQIWTGN